MVKRRFTLAIPKSNEMIGLRFVYLEGSSAASVTPSSLFASLAEGDGTAVKGKAILIAVSTAAAEDEDDDDDEDEERVPEDDEAEDRRDSFPLRV